MTREGPPVRSRRRVVTPDEARIWRAVVNDVTPLPGRPAALAGPEEEAAPPAAPPLAAQSPPRPPSHPVPARSAGLHALQHGTTAGVDRRTADRLKRGEMVIDATLDLHGLTQDVAHMQLSAFVLRAFDSGRRCLLVITGKGRDGGGVLRGQVPRWLNQPGLRERILGFCHARPQHGGEGALYVLVKRRR